MRTSEKLKALARIEQEAGQEAINAFGRELMALLARHGFQPITPEIAPRRPQKPARTAANKGAPSRSRPPIAPAPGQKAKEPPAHTDTGRILAAIRKNPGFRGFEVKPKAEADGKPEIHIKSFRTSLGRLKRKGFIRQDEGRWYPVAQKHETAA
jgi:hypothetical protein